MKRTILPLALLTFAPAALAQPDPAPPPAEPPPVEAPAPVAEPEPAPPPPPPPAAEAQEPVGPPPPASYPIEGTGPAPTAMDPTTDVRRHDGFYLRIGLGFGALVLSRDTETDTASSSDRVYTGESSIKGLAGVGEISIGGTVGNGIVLCGTLLGHEHREATLEVDEGDDIELGSSLSFGLIGMGVHYFPDPNGGFHIGGTAGLAYAVADAPSSVFEQLGGVGFGLSAAVGYDWWVADQWALGVMGRFTGARLHGEATEQGITAQEDDNAGAVAVMFSVLHH